LGKRLNWTKVEDDTLRRLARSGLLVGEIAALMGISAPTIRVHAAKLRIQIAKALIPCALVLPSEHQIARLLGYSNGCGIGHRLRDSREH